MRVDMLERHPERKIAAVAARRRRRERTEQLLAWLAFAAATTGAFVLALLPPT